MKTIYNLLNSNKKVALSLYNTLVKLKGLWCDIRVPIEQSSIFGAEDLIEYDEGEAKRERHLVYGLFKEAEIGMEGYDTFIDDCYILTPYRLKLERLSRVDVLFCGRTMSFKVDRHTNLGPTTHEQLFVKNILVPAT